MKDTKIAKRLFNDLFIIVFLYLKINKREILFTKPLESPLYNYFIKYNNTIYNYTIKYKEFKKNPL